LLLLLLLPLLVLVVSRHRSSQLHAKRTETHSYADPAPPYSYLFFLVLIKRRPC
jgi:hypothetical protein